jgi:hypothetical protein
VQGANGRRVSRGRFGVVGCGAFRLDFDGGLGGEAERAEIEQLSYALLEPLFPITKGIRLLGMTLSSLGEKQLESEPQLSLSI